MRTSRSNCQSSTVVRLITRQAFHEHRQTSAVGSHDGSAAAAAIAISVALNALGVFTEDEIHWVNLLIGAAVAAVAAVIVAVAAFWSGLPPVFGVAAIYLGRVARRAGTIRPRAPIAAVSFGSLALVADVVAYATDVASRY